MYMYDIFHIMGGYRARKQKLALYIRALCVCGLKVAIAKRNLLSFLSIYRRDSIAYNKIIQKKL